MNAQDIKSQNATLLAARSSQHLERQGRRGPQRIALIEGSRGFGHGASLRVFADGMVALPDASDN